MGKDETPRQEKTSATIASPNMTINSWGTSYTNDKNLSRLSSMKISRKDLLKQLAGKIKQSQIFLLFNIIIIIANATLLWLAWRKQDSHWIFSAIEAFVNFIFLLEIVLEILTDSAYFSKRFNLVDVIICFACWVLWAVYFEDSCRKNWKIDVESEINVDLLAARYVVQTLRISRYIMNAYVARRYLKQEDVKFDTQTTKMLSELLF